MDYDSSHPLRFIFGVNKSFVPPWSPNEDPRTAHLPLMQNPGLFLAIVALYLLIVILGPRWMKNRQAWNIRRVMQVYNVFLTLLSLYMAIEIPLSAYRRGMRYSCDPIRLTMEPVDYRVAQGVWLFFFSKIIEYADTIFMVVRKKNEQISFLHVYHHVSVSSIWYLVARNCPSGSTVFEPPFNCGVHVIMYSYYFLASLGDWMKPYLWWKRYITQVQMIQFVIIGVHSALVAYNDCGFPRWFAASMSFYMLSLYLLFLAFYRKSYTPAPGKKEK